MGLALIQLIRNIFLSVLHQYQLTMEVKNNTSSKNIPPNALSEAYQVHQDLLKTIDQMDVKIDEVIKQHEAQFLLAYRNHIKTMKEELTSIKQRADEQEKKMLSNDRAVYLEKQLILFREQALKLYDKLEEKTQECEHHKSQVKQFQKMKSIIEKENRQLLKNNKNAQAQIAIQQNRIAEISKQNSQLRAELQQSKQNIKELSKGQTLQTYQFTQNIQNHPTTPKPNKEIFNISINSRKQSRVPSLKPNKETEGSNISTKGRKMSQDLMDHQLKNWFLECIETIRRQVAQRKVYGYKSQNVNGIANWQEFRMIDKLRLLQMFMQNQKLLVWMYEKIFPSRINEVQSYLSSKLQPSFESKEKSKSAHISADDLLLEFPKNDKDPSQTINVDMNNDLILPKVMPSSNKKSMKKKYDVRQRIDIKNGKLNFSGIQPDS